ncbi:MAG: methyltransferase [Pedobacter sp.]|nr:methyltransferase [Pedobacter sp.]
MSHPQPSRSIFRFKQFEVDQSGCAMKINTDGVLLAALLDGLSPERILDIGTGTGVIALMLAQRFGSAQVDAIEIDSEAAGTAAINFRQSSFSARMSAIPIGIEQFEPAEKYDLIVSNPPYFVNDLKSAEEKKGIARHTHEGFFKDLTKKIAEILAPKGKFWFVLPIKQAKLLMEEAARLGLIPFRIMHLHSDESKPAFRYIVGLGWDKESIMNEHFYIYESEKVHTRPYRALLKDFFIAF